ncbi:serine hydrolase domain-containing protein [Cupriavidus alkaliphilus]|uniref:serine hydrolase domain-containing protein n=1 Tax=Cupriavidus alkaliphilus TaxID=942866 RepID=UPI001617FBDE|nr:serine hydrolase domain-containing protein [Cupriavidus alkaliphilus]MBB3014157.1 CubicO group peptidase (beta-lactamase class C family) [Cupriavidus alkaliphilus]
MSDVNGHCDPRFARVHDALAANIAAGKEVGASLYVNIDGVDVVDLWGGWRDKEHSVPWSEKTVVNVFSATKTVTSLAVLMLADRGQIDLFAPVSRYWPEFAQNGKEKAEVRHLISHTVGLPAWEPPFSLAAAMDVETATARLASQAPWWEPGTRGSYHASSFGHLNAELVRRVTGRSLSQFIADEIVKPLDADFYLGLSDADFDKVATVYPAEEEGRAVAAAAPSSASAEDDLAVERAISARTRLGSFSGQKRDPLALFNSPEWRRAEFGGSSGHANARGLGRIMTALSHDGMSRGVKLLSPETISLIFREQFRGVDSYYMKPVRWGIGYALAPLDKKERGPLPFMRPGKRTCYWYGTGGSLSIADVERRITFTYAMNQCQSGRHSLNGLYYDTFYDCL